MSSNEITKNQLLNSFIKINQFNYKCKTCHKTYKTPNGGVGNLKSHFITHLKAPKDKAIPGKINSQLYLLPETNDDCDDPICIVSIFYLNNLKVITLKIV